MAIDLSRLRKAVNDNGGDGGDSGSQTLRGNGSSQPRIKRDSPSVRNARRDAISRMTDEKGAPNSDGRRAAKNARAAEALSPTRAELPVKHYSSKQTFQETDRKSARPRGRSTLN